MTTYREILRLHNLNLSQQTIADSCSVSKETVNSVLKKAKEKNISQSLDNIQTDQVLTGILFPEKGKHSCLLHCTEITSGGGSCQEQHEMFLLSTPGKDALNDRAVCTG